MKVWEGEISCSCGEKHLLYCYKETKPTENYTMKYKCLKAHKDLTGTEYVELSSKLISNTVAWDEMKNWSAAAIVCEIKN